MKMSDIKRAKLSSVNLVIKVTCFDNFAKTTIMSIKAVQNPVYIRKVKKSISKLVQSLYKIASKTNIGPVCEMMINGCPANIEKIIPHIDAPTIDSIAPIWPAVAAWVNAPNVMIGVMLTKNMKSTVEMHCMLKKSTQSDR